MNEESLARSLLEKKEKGFTLLGSLCSIKARLVFRMVIIVVLYFFYAQSSSNEIFYLGIGYVLGMTIQDISWFTTIAKNWSFTIKVTDWKKVKELANEHR